MKLDRNITNPRRGKYALIKLRETSIARGAPFPEIPQEAIDFGDTPDTDFFVIRLKDKYAEAALLTYAYQARKDDPEYADEIFKLATLAANHPNKRKPD